MTDPYYVQAMVKAGAIITDEGGILSPLPSFQGNLGFHVLLDQDSNKGFKR